MSVYIQVFTAFSENNRDPPRKLNWFLKDVKNWLGRKIRFIKSKNISMLKFHAGKAIHWYADMTENNNYS